MTLPLLSPHWYRVAALRPRLRAGVQAVRHRVRGETWVLLTDPLTGRHHRFNRRAWALLAGCDGERTLDALWSAQADAADAATQDEVLTVIAQAFSAQLLVADVPAEAAALLRARRRERGRERRAAVHPLAFRVRLADPDAALTRWAARLRPLLALACSGAGLALLGALLLAAVLLLAVHGEAFARHATELAAGPRLWLLAWLAYPLVKALHEAAHALVVKHHGGAVHSVGLTLMVLTPVPYVDASAAVAFADKRRRAEVAGAGIATELMLAALALLAWVLLEPGWLRDAACAVVLVVGVSTLLVNGNPLLRFDGYHLATDLLELPNLASRSALWWRLRWRRAFGAPHARLAHVAPGERPWLELHAPLSLLMQAVLMAAAVAVLAGWNGWVALGVAVVAGWMLLLAPLLRGVTWVAGAPELHGVRTRAVAQALAVAALLLVLAGGVPLPDRTHAPGLVWLPDDAFARSASEGFIVELPRPDGSRVQAGDVIARLDDPRLQVQVAVSAAELGRAQVEQVQHFATDARASAQAADRVARLQAEHDAWQRRLDGLVLRASHAGQLVLDTRRVRVGQFVPEGEVIAQVLPDAHVAPAGAMRVRAFVGNDDIVRIESAGTLARVTLADGRQHRAQLLPARGAASRELPSAALGEAAGGAIALDPSDPAGRTAASPRLALELALPTADAPVGSRALVSFDHGSASLLELAAGALRRLFLRQWQA
jgi:putative peptide zinc metalloprotease protein